MPNPKRRHSSARRDKRRAHWKLTGPTLVKCSNPACDGVHMPHHVCPTCGKYGAGDASRQVLTLRRGETAEA